MKTLVIVSDTHGNKSALKKMENIVLEADYAIHLGDGLTDIYSLCEEAQNKFIMIEGNCDGNTGLEYEKIIDVEDNRIYMTHGHLLGVKGKKDRLADYAKSCNCNIALYGHTHKAMVENINGVKLINPGTLSRTSAEWSFCYLVIEKDKAVATINKNLF